MEKDNANIYIIEDDDFLRSLMINKLQTAGYLVDGFSDGRTGMDALWRDMPDLLVLDLILPGMHGFEILEKIRTNSMMKSLKVIVFSNVNSTEDIKRARDLNVENYLIKASFTLDELLDKVKESLAR